MASKYDRIASELRTRIHAGEWGTNGQLPSETDLAAQYRVTVPTLRAAMRVLKAEGVIASQHGRGTFVRAPRQPIQRSPERYEWEKARVHASTEERLGTGATEKDTGLTFDDLEFYISYHELEASDDIAEVFGVPRRTKMLQRIYRTRSRHEDAPISLVTSYIVHDVAAKNPQLLDEKNEPWPGGTQHQLWTVGIELGSIADHIRTRPPSTEEAEQLGIDPEGVAVFLLRKISKDIDGRVVEVSDVILPGDRTEFVYNTQLTRWESA